MQFFYIVCPETQSTTPKILASVVVNDLLEVKPLLQNN